MEARFTRDRPRSTDLEKVRCLACGQLYLKPTRGGSLRENPGCPACGYVGWTGAWIERIGRTD